MKIPNADRAIIEEGKLVQYLLNPGHKRGGPKPRLLTSLGYRPSQPEVLERALREQHLTLEVSDSTGTPYGIMYEIEGPIIAPDGRTVALRSVWQIDTGTDVPRLITM